MSGIRWTNYRLVVARVCLKLPDQLIRSYCAGGAKVRSAVSLNSSGIDTEVTRLERKSLAERVADELRDLVLLEKLKPGATIPERETAQALGVSRTPLRESLRILSSEGLIDIEPNRPPKVADPSIAELSSLLEVQGALEALAGELACRHADEHEIKKIVDVEATMRATSDTSDPLEFFQLDMQLHSLIVAASGNQPLIDTHRHYNSRLWRARFISSRERVNRPGTLDQHAVIVQTLEKRDGKACAQALKHHLHAGYLNIESALANKQPT